MATQTEIPLDQEGEFDDHEWLKPADYASEIQQQQSDLEGYYSIYEDQLRINQNQRRGIAKAQTDGLQDILNFGKSVSDIAEKQRREYEKNFLTNSRIAFDEAVGVGLSLDVYAKAWKEADASDESLSEQARLAGALRRQGNLEAAQHIESLNGNQWRYFESGLVLNYANNSETHIRNIIENGIHGDGKALVINGKTYDQLGGGDADERLAFVEKAKILYLEQTGLLDAYKNRLVIEYAHPTIASAVQNIFDQGTRDIEDQSNDQFLTSTSVAVSEIAQSIITSGATVENNPILFTELTGILQSTTDRFQGKNNAQAIEALYTIIAEADKVANLTLNTDLRDWILNVKLQTSGGATMSIRQLYPEAFSEAVLDKKLEELSGQRAQQEELQNRGKFNNYVEQVRGQGRAGLDEVRRAAAEQGVTLTPYQIKVLAAAADQSSADESIMERLNSGVKVPLAEVLSIKDFAERTQTIRQWIKANGNDLEWKFSVEDAGRIERTAVAALIGGDTGYDKRDNIPAHIRLGLVAVTRSKISDEYQRLLGEYRDSEGTDTRDEATLRNLAIENVLKNMPETVSLANHPWLQTNKVDITQTTDGSVSETLTLIQKTEDVGNPEYFPGELEAINQSNVLSENDYNGTVPDYFTRVFNNLKLKGRLPSGVNNDFSYLKYRLNILYGKDIFKGFPIDLEDKINRLCTDPTSGQTSNNVRNLCLIQNTTPGSLNVSGEQTWIQTVNFDE